MRSERGVENVAVMGLLCRSLFPFNKLPNLRRGLYCTVASPMANYPGTNPAPDPLQPNPTSNLHTHTKHNWWTCA